MFFYRIFENSNTGFGDVTSEKLVLPYYAPVFCYDYCFKHRFGKKDEEIDMESDGKGLFVRIVYGNEDESYLQKFDLIIEFNENSLDKNGFLINGGLFLFS